MDAERENGTRGMGGNKLPFSEKQNQNISPNYRNSTNKQWFYYLNKLILLLDVQMNNTVPD